MKKKIDEATRDKILDELLEKHADFDPVCHEIYFTLLAYEKLRFNQLLRTLKKLGIKITQPTLTEHLSHLVEKRIVEKEEGFQKTIYSLREDISAVMHPSTEDLKAWFDTFDNEDDERLRPLKITRKDLYERLTDEEIDESTVKDLSDTITLSLFEFKNFIQYDLEIDEFDSDAAFWKFVGNPMYRMHEKSIVENCRYSDRYKKNLFEKIDLLINELRSDKELFRKREERRKKQLNK
jgi:DNA-binding HxlR family transcriptional regulator